MTDDLETTTETSSADDFELETEQAAAFNRPESMEESAAAVLAELRGEAGNEESQADENLQGDEGKKAEEPIRDPSEAARILASQRKQKRKTVEAKDLEPVKGKKEKAPDPAVSDEKFEPPAWLDAKHKEEYDKLPVELKRFGQKYFKDTQAGITKLVQEIQPLKQRYAGFDHLVRNYEPEWHKRGIPTEAALAQMCADWKARVSNPLQHIADAMDQARITPQALADFLDQRQGGRSVQQYQQQKDFAVTPEDIRRIVAEESARSQQMYQGQTALMQAKAEVDSVRQLRNQAGQYLYPELHGEQPKGLDILVQFEKDSDPSISWAEATKRGINVYRYRNGSQGPVSSPQRLTPQQEIEKVRSAAVSTRGRGNPSIPRIASAKTGESINESADIVWQQLKQNSH